MSQINADPEVVSATAEHRTLLRQLFELYCHDFSPMTGDDVRADGRYTGDDFLAGWPERGPRIFLLRVAGQWAGFAWVGRGSYTRPGEADHWLMEEFCILRKYRRQGLGQRLAARLFDQFPGTWEIGEIPANTDAQAFWRRILGRYTQDRFTEVQANTTAWQGPVQVFSTP
jgi:predicted acetyltransferase